MAYGLTLGSVVKESMSLNLILGVLMMYKRQDIKQWVAGVWVFFLNVCMWKVHEKQ